MKDVNQEMLEAFRPIATVDKTIAHCLERLYADKKHNIEEEIVKNLTFEELIGALLQAQDLVRAL